MPQAGIRHAYLDQRLFVFGWRGQQRAETVTWPPAGGKAQGIAEKIAQDLLYAHRSTTAWQVGGQVCLQLTSASPAVISSSSVLAPSSRRNDGFASQAQLAASAREASSRSSISA